MKRLTVFSVFCSRFGLISPVELPAIDMGETFRRLEPELHRPHSGDTAYIQIRGSIAKFPGECAPSFTPLKMNVLSPLRLMDGI